MGEVFVTPPSGATQSAAWRTSTPEGLYWASVILVPGADDGYGKFAWSWRLQFASTSLLGSGCSPVSDDDYIWTIHRDPRKALTTLAALVSAWGESLPGGENSDLFPKDCEPFLGAIEEFESDLFGEEGE